MTTQQPPSSTSDDALELLVRGEVTAALGEADVPVPDSDHLPFWEATGFDSLDAYAFASDLEKRLEVQISDDMISAWATQADIIRDLSALMETTHGR